MSQSGSNAGLFENECELPLGSCECVLQSGLRTLRVVHTDTFKRIFTWAHLEKPSD